MLREQDDGGRDAMRWIRGLALAAMLAACTDSADTFPLNEQARRIGSPTLSFVRTGTGRGPVTITMPDGEVLRGDYRINRSGFIGTAFAGRHSATTIGMGDGFVQFVANGPRTQLLCRGVTGALSNHGNGECESAAGARWAVSW